MKKILLCLLVAITSCSRPVFEMVETTENNPWVSTSEITSTTHADNPDIIIETSKTVQNIEGFGACFNELGWTALQHLSPDDRAGIFKELFKPGIGANFNICRMPIAANDFARNWYSYNETEGDFEMANFSISNDEETLIPYIKTALNYNPSLKIWASPWSPPQWMKYNKHYAASSVLGNSEFQSDDLGIDLRGINNGLPPEREGREGTDMFIQQPRYFQAYATYFSKFIEAYKNEGIDIFKVMPQNEFNSAQVFPSCTWTAAGLSEFIGSYLGPEMKKHDVEVMLGTMERPNEALVDTVLNNNQASKYITGVGFQWAGKEAIPDINRRYPEMRFYQTEQECGNGKNDWKNSVYSWGLMKHYLTHGTNAYMYWNIALNTNGISSWGWKQNSLVSVDVKNNTYNYNHEYYLLKHVSHFVQSGAKLLDASGTFDNLLAFVNPDSSIVLVMRNNQDKEKVVTINIDEKFYKTTLKPDSFTSVKIIDN